MSQKTQRSLLSIWGTHMRIRAIVAAVSGAVALTALAVPAAQAAGTPDVTFSNMKVNKGKNIVVGASAQVSVPVTYTVTHPASVSASSFQTGPVLYRGTSVSTTAVKMISDDPGTCTAASTTVLNCTATIYIRPAEGDLTNSWAGTWNVGGLAVDKDAHTNWQGGLGTRKVLRLAKLTTNATPEPVRKGRTITVAGKLSRANWDTNTYAGYAGQYVKLQFKKKGATTYTTLKTIKSSSTGTLKTTVTASADGYFRYVFTGSATTSAVNSAADYIDVQ